MAEHGLGVEILSPEEALFAGEAVAVVTKTSEGELSIMADHAELIGDIAPGVITLHFASADPISILAHGGFLQVTTAPGAGAGLIEGASESDRTTRVTILAGIAELTNEIDRSRAETAKARAEARVAELKATSTSSMGDDDALRDAYLELAQAEADLARADLRLGTHAPLS